MSFESSFNDHVENVSDCSHIKNILSQYVKEVTSRTDCDLRDVIDVVREVVSTLETMPVQESGVEISSKDLKWSDLLRMNGYKVFDMINGVFTIFKDPVTVLRYVMDICSQKGVLWKVVYKYPPINRRGDYTGLKFELNPHCHMSFYLSSKYSIVSYLENYACLRCIVKLKVIAYEAFSTVFEITYRDKEVIYPLSFSVDNGKLEEEFYFAFTGLLDEGWLEMKCDRFLGAYRIEIMWEMGYYSQGENFIVQSVKEFPMDKLYKRKISQERNMFQSCSYKVLYYDMMEERNMYLVRPRDAVRNISQQRSMYDDLFHQVRMRKVNDMCSVCYSSSLEKEGCVLGEKFIGPMQCNHPVCFDCFRKILGNSADKYSCPICRFSFCFPFKIEYDFLKNIQHGYESSDSDQEWMVSVPETPYWLKCPSCKLKMEWRGNILKCYQCCLQRLQIRCLLCQNFLYLIIARDHYFGYKAGSKVCFNCQ